MAELRKWWCVMLMENFGLERHGKLFAHYTEESKAFMRGDQQPVFRLRKRRFEEISQVDETSLTLEFVPEKLVVQSPRKVRVMSDLKTASQWCMENSGDLLGSIQLPRILCMEDEEAAEALDRFFSAEFIKDDLIGNGCFQLIDRIAQSKEKDIHIVDLYTVPTWLPPNNCDPMLSIPGFPGQPYGNDCGVFMLMSALYIVLDAPFDYTILDMAELRKWWCVMLMENFGLERHGKLFAHYTEESKAFMRGDQQPVFRLRKRRFEEISQVDETSLTLEFVPEKLVVQSPRKVRVMSDLKTASQWCMENSGDLLGSIQLPRILCMEDEEAAEALDRFFSAEFIKDDLVEPLIFVFEFMQDMHKFLEHVVDNLNLRIFSRTQN
ncbi:hypothetical protein ROHU_032411 [Labeo rohita]|uniref:Uncharacterized protein n=1 Tax=Labeo rohita TaxID=84645 RepID=A0A498LGC9_LABRO|nr:hypothetical protein ROHU_032411 [Labeo rohita]